MTVDTTSERDTKPNPVLSPKAWLYTCGDVKHLHATPKEHFYSMDGGVTFVVGEPLVSGLTAQASLLGRLEC